MRRQATALLLVIVAGATASCGGSTPTAPTTSTPSPAVTPSPSIVTRRLTGIVRDGSSRPVSGASVKLYSGNGLTPTTITNSSGFYETVVDLSAQYVVPWIYADVTKPGYEPTHNGAMLRNQDTNADFYLFELERMTAGSQTRLAMTFDGPLCGFELEYACRHVQVIAPAVGTVTIEVVADDPAGGVGFGPVTYPMSSKTTRMSRFLQAGERIEAEVLLLSATPWSGVHSFTLRTEFAR